mgnify:CR=1 FL=1
MAGRRTSIAATVSAHHFEVEQVRAQRAPEPNPDWQQLLGAARGADVAQVDHPGLVPAKLSQHIKHLRLCGRIVAADEQVVVTERHRAGVDHQFAAQRVERQGDRCLIRWILGLVFQDHCLGAVVAQCAANGVLVSAAHARRAIRVSPSWLVQPAILLIGHPGNPPCCNQFLA